MHEKLSLIAALAYPTTALSYSAPLCATSLAYHMHILLISELGLLSYTNSCRVYKASRADVSLLAIFVLVTGSQVLRSSQY
jgi:hypothetical protein